MSDMIRRLIGSMTDMGVTDDAPDVRRYHQCVGGAEYWLMVDRNFRLNWPVAYMYKTTAVNTYTSYREIMGDDIELGIPVIRNYLVMGDEAFLELWQTMWETGK